MPTMTIDDGPSREPSIAKYNRVVRPPRYRPIEAYRAMEALSSGIANVSIGKAVPRMT
jgi:hypothetical protein